MSWPEIEGAYVVGDATAPVAVCVLTSTDLMAPLAAAPGVAIAGEVQTANLGLERIVLNVVANPAIRFLLLSVPAAVVGRFREQVELVDWTGEQDVAELRRQVESLAARRPPALPPPGDVPRFRSPRSGPSRQAAPASRCATTRRATS